MRETDNRSLKGLLLLSGGIDSPVAGHMMMQRGLEVEAIHFSFEPFTDDTPERKSREVAKLLGFSKLYIANIQEPLAEIVRNCEHRYYFVLSKRFMFRVAERIARQDGCDFLITGENLGQVSSQTLRNLGVIDAAVQIPVLRPLLGFDKVEIMEKAREIGTYEISKGRELCDVLGPEKPSTWAKGRRIREEEERLDLTGMIGKVVEDVVAVVP